MNVYAMAINAYSVNEVYAANNNILSKGQENTLQGVKSDSPVHS